MKDFLLMPSVFPRFLTIEGPPRSGKTTRAENIQTALVNNGEYCLVIDDFLPNCTTSRSLYVEAYEKKGTIVLVGKAVSALVQLQTINWSNP
jgi:tRNA uridine 5-carbamoylmethylation protein Kti12